MTSMQQKKTKKQLDVLNTLALECLERQSSSKIFKCTRLPITWMKNLDASVLQQQRSKLRDKAQQTLATEKISQKSFIIK